MSLPTDDKARKALPLFTFLMEYFPDTFLAVANVSIAGNNQHNPGEPLHWARHKSKDQLNTAFRHLWDYGRGTKVDTDGQYHLAKAIWRLSAQLQLDIEAGRSRDPMKWPCEDENFPRAPCTPNGHTCKQLPVGLDLVDDVEGTHHGYRTDQEGRDAPRPGKEAFSTDYAIGYTHGSKEGAARSKKG